MAATAAAQSAVHTGTKRRLKIWFIVIALFMAWASCTFIQQLAKQGQAELQLAEQQKKYEDGNNQMNDLKQQVERLNDKEYIGQLAMKEFGMVKKGEKQIEVVK